MTVEFLINAFKQYGLVGLIIFALGWFVLYIMKSGRNDAEKRHKAMEEERKTFHNMWQYESKANREATNNMTVVLNQIKAVLDERKY